MAREYETILAEERGEGLLLLTLNRPEVANAMNTQMGHDLLTFFDAVNATPAEQRCIVLTGAGGRAFCAGGDLKERYQELLRTEEPLRVEYEALKKERAAARAAR